MRLLRHRTPVRHPSSPIRPAAWCDGGFGGRVRATRSQDHTFGFRQRPLSWFSSRVCGSVLTVSAGGPPMWGRCVGHRSRPGAPHHGSCSLTLPQLGRAVLDAEDRARFVPPEQAGSADSWSGNAGCRQRQPPLPTQKNERTMGWTADLGRVDPRAFEPGIPCPLRWHPAYESESNTSDDAHRWPFAPAVSASSRTRSTR